MLGRHRHRLRILVNTRFDALPQPSSCQVALPVLHRIFSLRLPSRSSLCQHAWTDAGNAALRCGNGGETRMSALTLRFSSNPLNFGIARRFATRRLKSSGATAQYCK